MRYWWDKLQILPKQKSFLRWWQESLKDIPMLRSILHKYCKNYAILQRISVLRIIQQNSLDLPQRNLLFMLSFPKINPHNFFKMRRWESWFMRSLLVSARVQLDCGSKNPIFKQNSGFRLKKFWCNMAILLILQKWKLIKSLNKVSSLQSRWLSSKKISNYPFLFKKCNKG